MLAVRNPGYIYDKHICKIRDESDFPGTKMMEVKKVAITIKAIKQVLFFGLSSAQRSHLGYEKCKLFFEAVVKKQKKKQQQQKKKKKKIKQIDKQKKQTFLRAAKVNKPLKKRGVSQTTQ